jgi:periplasmic divalent cation tolerance protein
MKNPRFGFLSCLRDVFCQKVHESAVQGTKGRQRNAGATHWSAATRRRYRKRRHDAAAQNSSKEVPMPEILTVFVTTANEEEAVRIAKILVTERLAACANMVSEVRSIYRWKGEIWDTQERLLIIKTRAALFPALEMRVRALHSYEVPEIVAIPIVAGSAPYLEWVLECTRREAGDSV